MTSTKKALRRKDIFYEKLAAASSCNRSVSFATENYAAILNEVKEAYTLQKNKQPLSTKLYRRLKRYDILKIGDDEKLIEKSTSAECIRVYCKKEDLFDVLEKSHIDLGHKRTRVMEAQLKQTYCNITRNVIDMYLSLCKSCQLKKKMPKRGVQRGLVVRPILSDFMNSRCQVDLIDMQSEADGPYKFIMNYQDHLTKFTILRPLKTKTAEEVAYQLMDIFSMFGAPFILQSDNGREFANRIIQSLAEMWPGMKLVHGKPRHSQSQGSVERSNQDVRDMLVAWMSDKKTKAWSEGLRFIQSEKNRALHDGIKRSPYEAMFGNKQKIGLADSPLTEDVYQKIHTEEDLEELANSETTNAGSSNSDEDIKEDYDNEDASPESGKRPPHTAGEFFYSPMEFGMHFISI